MKKIKKIWVYDGFAKLIKTKAVENDKSIIDYTKELAEKERPIKKIKPINENFWKLL